VLTQQARAGAPQQPSEHERDQDRVVQLTRDRDEVGHEVERKREVDEREHGRGLPDDRNPRIAQQALEQDRAVRHEARDHPDVPLPAAHDERRDHRRVDDAENDKGE
jgi:hypothetical protein